MLATALGYQAVEAGYRAYYTTAADLVARTTKAALEGRWETTMRFWNGPQVLIIDELGYLPMPAEAASHLFQVVTRRYEHGSIILTTNRHIADWGQIFARHHPRDRDPRPPPAPRHRRHPPRERNPELPQRSRAGGDRGGRRAVPQAGASQAVAATEGGWRRA